MEWTSVILYLIGGLWIGMYVSDRIRVFRLKRRIREELGYNKPKTERTWKFEGFK